MKLFVLICLLSLCVLSATAHARGNSDGQMHKAVYTIAEIRGQIEDLCERLDSLSFVYRDDPSLSREGMKPLGSYLRRNVAAKRPGKFLHCHAHGHAKLDWRDDPFQQRLFVNAEVTPELCQGSPRIAERRYTNLSANELRPALIDKGYVPAQMPAERTIRDILNRMNYRFKRIQKRKPL